MIDDVKHQAAADDIVVQMAKPILYYLTMPEIEEIAINRPGEIWLRLRKPNDEGETWERHIDDRLNRKFLQNLIYSLANVGGQGNFGINPDQVPICYGTFPGGHRFAAGIGPTFQFHSGTNDPQGTIIMSSRQYRPESGIQLSDLGLIRGVKLEMLSVSTRRKLDEADAVARLLGSLRRGDHILISGATGTGKTTLMNSLIRMLDKRLRILTVEDTSEISIPQPNHYHVLLNRSGQANLMTYQHVVDLIVRSTPDIVLAGEISTTNAAAIWELMRSGHGHFMTTIHAESTDEALETFVTRISHSKPDEVRDRDRVIAQMAEKLRVLQMNFVSIPTDDPNVTKQERRITAIT